MEIKKPRQITARADRELREHLEALKRGETPPPRSTPAAKPAEAEERIKLKGSEGLGTGRMTDSPRKPGGMEGFGKGRFRG